MNKNSFGFLAIGLLTAELAVMPRPAYAGPFPDPGPGFGISGYQATAIAEDLTASDLAFDSIPGTQASAAISLVPFNYAIANAANYDMSGVVSTNTNGGLGLAGANAGVKSQYTITNNVSNILNHFVFTFLATGSISAIGVVPGVAAISFGTDIQVASDSGTAETKAGASLSEAPNADGSATVTGDASIFSLTPDPALNGRYLFSGITTVAIDAIHSVDVFAAMNLVAEVFDVYTVDSMNMTFQSMTYSNASNFVAAIVGTPSPPSSPIDEPPMAFLVLSGLMAWGVARQVAKSRLP